MAESPRRLEAPIIIFAFDRGEYLRRFCLSLKAQEGIAIDERRIFLLQDGAVSRRSGVRYATDAAMAESVTAFRSVFPAGQVVASPENLGIAGNIQRGERMAFDSLEAETAYFFEDDLELGPAYMVMMERMREALSAFPEVGYFAAYGDHRQKPKPTRVRMVPLDHHWGFGLRRTAWKRIAEWLKPYYGIIGQTDYPNRNHLGVYRFLAKQDMAIDKSSQDALKALAAAKLGIARVMTDLCFARYIGAKGASFSEKRFFEMGYDRMEAVGAADLPLEGFTAERVASALAEQQQRFRDFRQHEFDGFLERYGARHWDPDRLVTRDDVSNFYRLFLDRLPEGEQVYEAWVGKKTVATMRHALMGSREFQGRNFR
ncbi:hypothetical protein BKE38_22535 [Pseudoroseomonas deserti]|uniref:Glycosyltransferase 2-like domain-containing protein n=1 Tax=Teichococcus deserti TaxID=1817963 RepID=A0A1V2GWP9_9PROT|nr:hypothetical protein [Pseudoroseomonas deserti]ONG47871.1 hypothetical protein BKE38_22535 [Pseudoroseomonas deserti]